MNKAIINKLIMLIMIENNSVCELDLNDILELKSILYSYIKYKKSNMKTIFNVNDFISNYYHLFVLMDNYISQFKYRIIMNNKMKNR